MNKKTLDSLAKIPAFLLSDTLSLLPLPTLLPLLPSLLSPPLSTNLIAPPLYPATKFPLLSLTNALLSRLSRPLHTAAIGTILSFISRALPLTERSGVNVKGEYGGKETAVGEKEDFVKQTNGQDEALEFETYAKFWSIQKFMSSPGLLASDSSGWSDCFNTVMTCLETHAWTDDDYKSLRKAFLAEKEATSSQAGEAPAVTFPPLKYLTSSSLLPLQLRDPDIHLSLCAQLLLTLDSLSAPLPKLRMRVQKHMMMVPPNGRELAKFVTSLGKDGEKRWREWKEGGCGDFIKVAVEREKAVWKGRDKPLQVSHTTHKCTCVNKGGGDVNKSVHQLVRSPLV